MSFTTTSFMVFGPLVILLYYGIPARWRVAYITLASLLFYGYWDYRYVPLLLISAAIDFYCSRRIFETTSNRSRKTWLLVSIFINVGILFFFKYWNFFLQNILPASTGSGIFHDLVLPLGLSFYTLQTLSYTFDVYRRKLQPERSFSVYFLYVSFFPQLVSGPIERAGHLIPQLKSMTLPTADMVRSGALLIAWGLFIKLCVSNNISPYMDYAYQQNVSGLWLWPTGMLGLIQVYCDFLGYTEIARGLALFFGVRLSENFRQPFFARDISAFWQKWHITLTRWVADYIALPLARKFPSAVIRPAIIIGTFGLIGLWHGATWGFILFGICHGAAIVLWRGLAPVWKITRPIALLKPFAGRLILFAVFMISAPMFFIRDTSVLLATLTSQLQFIPTDLSIPVGIANDLYVGIVMFLGVLINDAFVVSKIRLHLLALVDRPILRKMCLAGLILLIILFGNFNAAPFVYFEF